jgi:hypothetical protein
MALNKTAVLAATCKYGVLEHTGSQVSTNRIALTWSTSGANTIVSGTETFTGTAAAPVDAVGFYDAATGGNYYGNAALSSSDGSALTFNNDGNYNVVGLTVTG